MAVIPAKAGIHLCFLHQSKWIPAFAGMTAKVFRAYQYAPVAKSAAMMIKREAFR